jgi:hypothetical protein
MCGYVPAGLDCGLSISKSKASRTGRPCLISRARISGARISWARRQEPARAQRDRVYRSAS